MTNLSTQECLQCLYKDFVLLPNGNWVPDEESCEASKDVVKILVEHLKSNNILSKNFVLTTEYNANQTG